MYLLCLFFVYLPCFVIESLIPRIYKSRMDGASKKSLWNVFDKTKGDVRIYMQMYSNLGVRGVMKQAWLEFA